MLDPTFMHQFLPMGDHMTPLLRGMIPPGMQNNMFGFNGMPSFGARMHGGAHHPGLFGMAPHSNVLAGSGYANSGFRPAQSDIMRNNYLASMRGYSDQQLLNMDPRNRLIQGIMGNQSGTTHDIARIIMNSSFAAPYTGGDIRHIGAAAMTMTGQGTFMGNRLGFGGGILQQAAALDISKAVVGEMNSSGRIGSYDISRISEVMASLSGVQGSELGGGFQLKGIGNSGHVELRREDREKVTQSLRSAVRTFESLENIFGERAIPELIDIVKKLTGRTMRSVYEIQAAERDIRATLNMARSMGLDERAALENMTRGNAHLVNAGFAPSVANLIGSHDAREGMAYYSASKAYGGLISAEGHMGVRNQATARALGNSMSNRFRIYAEGMRGGMNAEQRGRLDALIESGADLSSSGSVAILEELTGRDFRRIDADAELRNRAMSVGSRTDRGRQAIQTMALSEMEEEFAPRRANIFREYGAGSDAELFAAVTGLVGKEQFAELAKADPGALRAENLSKIIFSRNLTNEQRKTVFAGLKAMDAHQHKGVLVDAMLDKDAMDGVPFMTSVMAQGAVDRARQRSLDGHYFESIFGNVPRGGFSEFIKAAAGITQPSESEAYMMGLQSGAIREYARVYGGGGLEEIVKTKGYRESIYGSEDEAGIVKRLQASAKDMTGKEQQALYKHIAVIQDKMQKVKDGTLGEVDLARYILDNEGLGFELIASQESAAWVDQGTAAFVTRTAKKELGALSDQDIDIINKSFVGGRSKRRKLRQGDSIFGLVSNKDFEMDGSSRLNVSMGGRRGLLRAVERGTLSDAGLDHLESAMATGYLYRDDEDKRNELEKAIAKRRADDRAAGIEQAAAQQFIGEVTFREAGSGNTVVLSPTGDK